MIDVKKLEDTARMLRSMPGLCMQQGADAIDEVLRAMREPVGWQRRYKSDHMKWSRWEEWCTDAREDPFPAKIGRWDAEYRPIYAAPPAPVVTEAKPDDRPTTQYTMNSRGGLVVDRAALHASKAYKNQVETASKLSESLGKDDRPTWKEVRTPVIAKGVAKYTPGPWTLQNMAPAIDAGNYRAGPDGTAFRIYGCSTLWLELRACGDGFVYGQNEANARLIAAAPDLLEAVQEGVAKYGEWDSAKAAISKALGVRHE